MSKKQKYHQSIVPGHAIAAAVPNKDIGYALRTWKSKLKNSDLLANLKDRTEYKKPSVIKRKSKADAIYRQKIRTLQEQ